MDASNSDVDINLLIRIAARDDSALAEFYDRHSRLAYSLIMRIVRSQSDAEEVLQETFVRVWSRTETYNALLGSPTAWLIRIARNRAIDRLRSRRVRTAVTAESPPGTEPEAVRAVEPITHDTPETVLAGNTTAGVVRSALASLTAGQRELIEAAFFEGYTHAELAARFGMPLGTVKTRIRAGLAAMRDRLEQVI
jgi:RNA polymerase sigma-70 factor (ECF subfamily)